MIEPQQLRRILFISASPASRAPTRVGDERRAIEAAIGKRYDLISVPSVNAEELTKLLHKHQPHVLHIAAHGHREHGIDFREESLRFEALAQKCKVYNEGRGHDRLLCVLLNVCDSLPALDELEKALDHAVAWDGKVPNQQVIDFVIGFYESLDAGQSFPTAVEAGRATLSIRNREVEHLRYRRGNSDPVPDPYRLLKRILNLLRRGPAWSWVSAAVGVLALASTPWQADIGALFDEAPSQGQPPFGNMREFHGRTHQRLCTSEKPHPRDKSCTTHRIVDVAGFAIDTYEATVEEYRACVDARRCEPPYTGPYCNFESTGRSDHPVNCVSWQDAKNYCAYRGKRVPSEDEWEIAALDSQRSTYSWGSDRPKCKDDEEIVGDSGKKFTCGVKSTKPVGSMSADVSEGGVYDMTGSLREWVVRRDRDQSEDARALQLRGGSRAADEASKLALARRSGSASKLRSRTKINASLRRRLPAQHALYGVGIRCSRAL